MRAQSSRIALFLAGALTIPMLLASAQVVTLPAGATLQVVMETRLNTKDSKTGDAFRSRLVMPVFVDEQEVLPIGCVVEGTVARVQGPGRVSGRAELQLRPEKMTLPSGEVLELAATVTSGQGDENTRVTGEEGTIQGSGKDGMDARGTATTATTGAVLGGIMGGGQGALIGAGAVGAIALIHQLFKRGNDAELPAGSELILELNRPLSFNPTMVEVPPEQRMDPGQDRRRLERRPELVR
jgi:hypothetical protein